MPVEAEGRPESTPTLTGIGRPRPSCGYKSAGICLMAEQNVQNLRRKKFSTGALSLQSTA